MPVLGIIRLIHHLLLVYYSCPFVIAKLTVPKLEVSGRESITVSQQESSDLSNTHVQILTMDDSSSEFTRSSMDRQSLRPDSPLQLDISSQILSIIFQYALNKFDDS